MLQVFTHDLSSTSQSNACLFDAYVAKKYTYIRISSAFFNTVTLIFREETNAKSSSIMQNPKQKYVKYCPNAFF